MTTTSPSPLLAIRRAHPRTVDGLTQLAIALVILGLYAAERAVPTDRAVADEHGSQLQRAESWLGIDVERSAQQLVLRHDWLGAITSWEYATAYIVTTFAVLGWAWWRGGSAYRWLRNVLASITLTGITCFALWPVTPPRLLPGAGFTDVVMQHQAPLSWGNSQVSAGADQFAAMPSLHTAWAIWVVLAAFRLDRNRVSTGLAMLQVAITVFVIVVTGNHYLLDAAGAAVIVVLAVGLEDARSRWVRARRARMAAPDEFFLHVEEPTVQQPVGGFVVLDTSGGPGSDSAELDLAAVKRILMERAPGMARFTERLEPAGALRHARWVPCVPDIDVHVREHRLPGDGGAGEMTHFVSALAEQVLDRGRPLWQMWFVPNYGPGQAAVLAVMHHCVADGLGIVDILRGLFDPALPLPNLSHVRRPAIPLRLAAGAVGLVELAADGSAERLPFTVPLSARRDFSYAAMPFSRVRQLARRHDVRVTDVVLSAVGQGVSDLLAGQGHRVAGRRLRAAVPVTTRLPAPAGTGRRAQPGNLTAALRLDVPLDPMSPTQRLIETARSAERRRRSGRALATTFVMNVIGVTPPPLHARAARAMYRGRYFNAIVSNMPGPTERLRMAEAPIEEAYPILPLAESVPLGVGTLGWAGQFCLSVVADPVAMPGTSELAGRIVTVMEQMVGDDIRGDEQAAGGIAAAAGPLP